MVRMWLSDSVRQTVWSSLLAAVDFPAGMLGGGLGGWSNWREMKSRRATEGGNFVCAAISDKVGEFLRAE